MLIFFQGFEDCLVLSDILDKYEDDFCEDNFHISLFLGGAFSKFYRIP